MALPPVAAAVAAQVVAPAAQAAAPVPAKAATWRDSFETGFKTYVNWTNTNGIDTKETFALKDNDGTCAKVMKVFLMLIASIALFPIAALGNLCSWVKSWVAESVKSNPPSQAPPAAAAAVAAAVNAANAAGAPAAAAAVAPAAADAPAADAGVANVPHVDLPNV